MEGVAYHYIWDDYRITGITNEAGIEIVKYTYADLQVTSVLDLQNGEWINNTDDTFIGNYNKLRSNGAYFEEETGWKNATYLACLMLTNDSESCWNVISQKPVGITNQYYFRSASKLANSTQIFESGGKLYAHYTSGDVLIQNVCIAGKGTATTVNGLKSLCTNGTGYYNVFFYHN